MEKVKALTAPDGVNSGKGRQEKSVETHHEVKIGRKTYRVTGVF